MQKVRPTSARRTARILIGVLVLSLLSSGCALSPVELEAQKPLAQRSTIVASDGSLLARLFRENRSLVALDEMAPHVIDAVLAAEDARFFQHGGFDLRSIVRAAAVNLSEGETQQGGSTITQQYVKNTYFEEPAKTFERKAREVRLAIEIERRYSKEQILEFYLNTVYFGSGAYGVKAAAEDFFGHGVGELTLAEAALLAAVIKSPAGYDPREHGRRAIERRNYVLDRMTELGKISVEQAAVAQISGLGVQDDPPPIDTEQPYFVEAVKRQVLADRRFGSSDAARTRSLWKGGLRIETTLEPDLQRMAEAAAKGVLGRPGDPEVALVSIRPSTGAVVAMVGGRDWSTSQVNLALGKAGGGSGRQPASAFKPIALAAALEAGKSLDDNYAAAPGIFPLADGSTWTVGNSEGTSGGFLSLREALIRSVNGVFARLALDIGGAAIAAQAQLMGVSADLSGHPSIALGAEEVSVLDMAASYATLANHGNAIEPSTIKSVTLPSGEVVVPQQKHQDNALSPGNAFLITKAMEQVIERGTGTAASIGRPAAAKTGTSNDYADAWFVGFTPQLVTAVWVGYPQGRIPMTNVHGIRVFGGTFPALIWRNFMLAAHQGLPVERFKLPDSAYVTIEIDPVSGLRSAPWCPGEKRRILRELVPLEFCPPPPPPEPTPFPTPTPSPSPSRSADEKKADGKDGPKDQPSPSPSGKDDDEPSPKPSTSPKGDG